MHIPPIVTLVPATSTSTVLNTRQSVDMILKSASFIAGLIPVTVRAAGNSIHQLDLTYANGQLSDSNYKDLSELLAFPNYNPLYQSIIF